MRVDKGSGWIRGGHRWLILPRTTNIIPAKYVIPTHSPRHSGESRNPEVDGQMGRGIPSPARRERVRVRVTGADKRAGYGKTQPTQSSTTDLNKRHSDEICHSGESRNPEVDGQMGRGIPSPARRERVRVRVTGADKRAGYGKTQPTQSSTTDLNKRHSDEIRHSGESRNPEGNGGVSPAQETENQRGNVRGLPRTPIRGTKGAAPTLSPHPPPEKCRKSGK